MLGKKISALVLFIVLSLVSYESCFAQNIDTKISLTTYVNDIEIKGMDVSFYEGGTVQIPMRAIFESMGMKVTWNSANDEVILDYNGYLFKCIKSKKIDDRNGIYEFKMINCLNEKKVEFYRLNGFDTCTVINGRIYLESDIVCNIINFFDGDFIFDEVNKTVKIYVDKNWSYKKPEKLKTYVNDIKLTDDSILEDGRYKIPFEAFFKSLGSRIKYDNDNNLILKYKNIEYNCPIYSALENGSQVYYMCIYKKNDNYNNNKEYIYLSPWSPNGSVYYINDKVYLSQLSAEYLLKNINGKIELDKKTMTLKLFVDKTE